MTRRKSGVPVWLTMLVLAWTVPAPAVELPEVMDTIAARLDQEQIKEGLSVGDWPLQWGFNGSIVAGMVSALECMQGESYRASALLGGDFILWEVRGDAFMGDELYAIWRLGDIDDGPDPEKWRVAVHAFFDAVGGTRQAVTRYTDLYREMDSSTAVFYLAHFAVTAHQAQVRSAKYWRQELIEHLARVGDGQASFPVMALGVATWALIQTGAMDDTLIGHYDRNPYWKGMHLYDLPALLASHQVPEGEPFSGSFYWRFDHTFGPFEGPLSGYTEDAIYGTLGLLAAASLEENACNRELDKAICTAGAALVGGVDEEGKVYEHLARDGSSYYAFAGEMLQVLCALHQYRATRSGTEADGECPCPCVDPCW